MGGEDKVTIGRSGQVYGTFSSMSGTNAIFALSYSNAPSIYFNPVSRSTLPGRAERFEPAISLTGPHQFQWFFNDSPVAGATNATFSLASASLADTGNYSIVVSNALGSATTAPAALWFFQQEAATTLSLYAPTSRTFQLQFTTNLASNIMWTTLTNVTLTTSPFIFTDDSATNDPARFYRSALLP